MITLDEFMSLKQGDVVETTSGIRSVIKHQLRPWPPWEKREKAQDILVMNQLLQIRYVYPRSKITKIHQRVDEMCKNCMVVPSCVRYNHSVGCFYEKNPDFKLPISWIGSETFSILSKGDLIKTVGDKIWIVLKVNRQYCKYYNPETNKYQNTLRKYIKTVERFFIKQCSSCKHFNSCHNNFGRIVMCFQGSSVYRYEPKTFGEMMKMR